ncbi:MAG: tetratricopeptide repeat protein, partial [Acidobacteria bacterium]|nr:tetratricopeptide repeat protein [Acidobacteriota bacterium]
MALSQAETELSLAHIALTRGRGAEAAGRLRRLARMPGLPAELRTATRIGLARAWLLQGQIQEARRALGPTPDKAGEAAEPSQLSALWCLHAQIAFRSGERSRAIALLGRALKYAETAHDSHAIGLARSELAQCYRHVGELAIVREHVSQATAALAAAGDHRHLALALTVTAVTAAQSGRLDEACSTLVQAEGEATLDEADDVLGLVCNNQANIAFIQHQHDKARELYERSVALAERCFPTYVLSISLASLGQCYVQIGELDRAETALKRALDARTQIQFHEITGAVYDSLAQMHLVRGEYETVESCLEQAFAAYGEFGKRAAHWYAWSPRALAVKLALRRGNTDEALRLSDEIAKAAGVPSTDRLDAELVACETLLLCDRVQDAEARLSRFKEQLDANPSVPAYGAYLRLRGQLRARLGRIVEAYHDLDQSISLFDLIHHPYEAGLSERALGEVLLAAGEHSEASRHLQAGGAIFARLGAHTLVRELEQAAATTGAQAAGQMHVIRRDAAALVRRVVDAAVLPQFLVRETAHALAEISGGSAVLFAQAPGSDVRVLGHAGCDDMTALGVARASMASVPPPEIRVVESLGRDHLGVRRMAIASREALAP